MDAAQQEEALAMFVGITDAPRHVAEHVLDAHHWDLNNAVAFYLESGGVGHGQGAPPGAAPTPGSGGLGGFAGGGADAGWEQPPALDPDVDEVEVVEEQPAPRRAAPTAAVAVPRSRPIVISDDDDEDLQVLASSLGRSSRPQPAGGRRRRGSTSAAGGDEEVRVGSLEDEFGVGGSGSSGGGGGRRQRRNRPGRAGSVDRDLQVLEQRFGVLQDDGVEVEDALPPSRLGRTQQPQQQQQQHGDGDEDMPVLPDDVDMEEQRMLMAALTGGAYEGALPDFANDPRFRGRALSPGAQARQQLREEQDAAYYESLQADMEREAVEARRKREEEEAQRAAHEAEEAEQRQQQEEAERLERTLSSKTAALPPEPADGGEGVVNLMIRLPGGSRIARRFHTSDSLQSVFDFIDVQRLEGLKPHTYHLVMQYPRRTFEETLQLTMAEAGLSAKQEALFLEMK